MGRVVQREAVITMASLCSFNANANMKKSQKQLLPQKATDQSGFTLIELTVILVIVGILSYIVIAKFADSHKKIQYETMIKKITSDVRFAQQLALTRGKGTQVFIDLPNNRYYLKWDDGTYVQNPVKGGNFVIQLGVGDFNEVQITGTGFTGGRLDFNRSGTPLNAGADFSGNLVLVSLNNTKRIVISANTGLMTIEDF